MKIHTLEDGIKTILNELSWEIESVSPSRAVPLKRLKKRLGEELSMWQGHENARILGKPCDLLPCHYCGREK